MSNENKSCTGKSQRTSGRKGSSRKQNRRFNTKEARFDKEATGGKTEASNNPGWYGAETALMRDAANLSFAQTAGLSVGLKNNQTEATLVWTAEDFVVPGIMELDVACLPGMVGDWSEPFNVSIRDKYSFIRHMNSGHANYDASDLGMYFLTYDSACTYYAYLCRMYGSLRTIVLRNRYLPTDVISVMGGAYGDLVMHMAELRYYINSFAARLSALKVPSDLTFIERHMWMFSNVFADAPTDKAQMYVFKPAGLWYHTITASDQYMQFKTVIPYGSATYADLKRIGEELLNAVLNSEDFNIMSGDIVKAYGDKVYELKLIPEEFAVAPVFDPEVLLQIHNATIAYTTDDTLGKWRLKENVSDDKNVGSITDGETLSATWNVGNPQAQQQLVPIHNVNCVTNIFLDIPVPNPGPKEIAIATRLCVRLRNDGHFSQYGTEVIVNAYRVTHSADGQAKRDMFIGSYENSIEEFGSHPIFFKVSTDGGTPSEGSSIAEIGLVLGDLVGDVDNYTVLHPEILGNIHRAALMSMFGLSK